MEVREATLLDLKELLIIYAKARSFMHANGNPTQWVYKPNKSMIVKDINNHNCYVVLKDNNIVGVFALILGEDPTYNFIEGKWLNDNPYGTIHRIASSFKEKNILETAIEFAKTKIKDIRIDTHRNNKIMLHKLEKNNFKYCGIIYIQDKTERLAFQLHID